MDRQAEALKSLLAQITSKEAELGEAEGGFVGEFSRLKRLSTKYRTENIFSTKAAEKRENVNKNRYKDIMPFDHTRVKLSFITSDTDTDYINASFIKGALQQKAYIATQGPLPHTVQDFWRMIWEYNVVIIVMACREFEMGRKKCERYWPEKKEEPFVCDPFTIQYESMESKEDYLTRVLRVTYCDTSRTLWQLHYVNWPDHGVPASIQPILELLQEMRSYQEYDDVPICIHCSAGCGRTGVLCVIDYIWKLLQNQLITEDFCIFKLVEEMRTQRPSIVQTKDQYELVYRTIKILFENYLQMMAGHSSAIEEDKATQSSSGERWNAPQEEEVALLELEMNPNSPGCWESSSFSVEDPYFSPSSPQDTLATLNPEESPPFDSSTSNLCPTTPALTLNDHPLELPQFETIAMVTYEDIPPSPPEQTPESYILAYSPGSPDEPITQWASAVSVSDDDHPPSIPERTPESYILANSPDSPERPSSSGNERLWTVPPLNMTETLCRNGSPPSPVPPLPERTPESFILATDDDLLQGVAQHDALRPNPRVGMSSEWCGSSEPPSLVPKKSWTRSKSLKVRMSMLVYSSVSLAPVPLHPLPIATHPPPTIKIGLGNQNSRPVLQPSGEPSQRIGTSSESTEHSQPKTFLDVVMKRSKSVRVKMSKSDRLSVACPATTTSLVVEPAGNASELNTDSGTSASAGRAGERQNESSGKNSPPSMAWAKNLICQKNKRKGKEDPPAAAASSEPLLSHSTSAGFRFGFGNRFRKPKGPRHQPDTWV